MGNVREEFQSPKEEPQSSPSLEITAHQCIIISGTNNKSSKYGQLNFLTKSSLQSSPFIAQSDP